MSLEPKPRVDAPVPDSRDYAEEQENSVAPALNDRNLPHNPHRYSLQWVAVIVAAIVVFVMFRLGGVMIIAAGVFTFLDAWNAGIYKNKEKDSFLNISALLNHL